jgi:hypothetical protein
MRLCLGAVYLDVDRKFAIKGNKQDIQINPIQMKKTLCPTPSKPD